MEVGFLDDAKILTKSGYKEIKDLNDKDYYKLYEIKTSRKKEYIVKTVAKKHLVGIKLFGVDKPLICGRDTELLIVRKFGNQGKRDIFIKAIDILRNDLVYFFDNYGNPLPLKIERSFFVNLGIEQVRLINLVFKDNKPCYIDGFITRNRLYYEGDFTKRIMEKD